VRFSFVGNGQGDWMLLEVINISGHLVEEPLEELGWRSLLISSRFAKMTEECLA